MKAKHLIGIILAILVIDQALKFYIKLNYFIGEEHAIIGSYSIDPAVFEDVDGKHYMFFGGLWGGQLQRYRNNKAQECGTSIIPALWLKKFFTLDSKIPKLDLFLVANEPIPSNGIVCKNSNAFAS